RALVAVSQLLADHSDRITELDVNPLVVLPREKGVVAVDALMFLAHNAPLRGGEPCCESSGC
ncbi:MAG: acetate--CoA ligase family protein, partial [Betaproteobacteria bacterium]|nr:acetate--CoA ligase family protein [Betaproteobacteria bacterium]